MEIIPSKARLEKPRNRTDCKFGRHLPWRDKDYHADHTGRYRLKDRTVLGYLRNVLLSDSQEHLQQSLINH
jgi:hypothetical protein